MWVALHRFKGTVESKESAPFRKIPKIEFMKLRRASADKMARSTGFPESVRNRFIELRKSYDQLIVLLSKNS